MLATPIDFLPLTGGSTTGNVGIATPATVARPLDVGGGIRCRTSITVSAAAAEDSAYVSWAQNPTYPWQWLTGSHVSIIGTAEFPANLGVGGGANNGFCISAQAINGTIVPLRVVAFNSGSANLFAWQSAGEADLGYIDYQGTIWAPALTILNTAYGISSIGTGTFASIVVADSYGISDEGNGTFANGTLVPDTTGAYAGMVLQIGNSGPEWGYVTAV